MINAADYVLRGKRLHSGDVEDYLVLAGTPRPG